MKNTSKFLLLVVIIRFDGQKTIYFRNKGRALVLVKKEDNFRIFYWNGGGSEANGQCS
jgi:hypothetical protein